MKFEESKEFLGYPKKNPRIFHGSPLRFVRKARDMEGDCPRHGLWVKRWFSWALGFPLSLTWFSGKSQYEAFMAEKVTITLEAEDLKKFIMDSSWSYYNNWCAYCCTPVEFSYSLTIKGHHDLSSTIKWAIPSAICCLNMKWSELWSQALIVCCVYRKKGRVLMLPNEASGVLGLARSTWHNPMVFSRVIRDPCCAQTPFNYGNFHWYHPYLYRASFIFRSHVQLFLWTPMILGNVKAFFPWQTPGLSQTGPSFISGSSPGLV